MGEATSTPARGRAITGMIAMGKGGNENRRGGGGEEEGGRRGRQIKRERWAERVGAKGRGKKGEAGERSGIAQAAPSQSRLPLRAGAQSETAGI